MSEESKPLRNATYLLRFTPAEKAELEQKVRRVAAASNAPLSLAEALRLGGAAYLDDLLAKYEEPAAGEDFRVSRQVPERESSVS